MHDVFCMALFFHRLRQPHKREVEQVITGLRGEGSTTACATVCEETVGLVCSARFCECKASTLQAATWTFSNNEESALHGPLPTACNSGCDPKDEQVKFFPPESYQQDRLRVKYSKRFSDWAAGISPTQACGGRNSEGAPTSGAFT